MGWADSSQTHLVTLTISHMSFPLFDFLRSGHIILCQDNVFVLKTNIQALRSIDTKHSFCNASCRTYDSIQPN
jgi:hypothetical protein